MLSLSDTDNKLRNIISFVIQLLYLAIVNGNSSIAKCVITFVALNNQVLSQKVWNEWAFELVKLINNIVYIITFYE